MSTLLKDIYSKELFNGFSLILNEVVPSFNKNRFIQLIFDKEWQAKELKERMSHASYVLSALLSKDFKKSAVQVKKIISLLQERGIKEKTIEYMFIPDYIEKQGINYFEESVELIETVTQFTSCEYAVRPFIIRYGNKMMKQMQLWSLHKSHHVRRLASEGSRPRLPWAIALPGFKKDPLPVLPILENLKNDPSEYVRRSVANNLNDIAKDHPGIVISIVKEWSKHSKETDEILKHGCRTLLKNGNTQVLSNFGFKEAKKILMINFRILTPKVKIGHSLEFSFTLHNTNNKKENTRIEYGLYYLRQGGQHSRKVFKISERTIESNEKIELKRKQSFKLITTRVFYEGEQKLSIIINGQEREIRNFHLLV